MIVPAITVRSLLKPSTNATWERSGDITGDCSCHSAAYTSRLSRRPRSSTATRASYQALSLGSLVITATASPSPVQSNSQTLTPSGLTSVVSPLARSMRQSLRQDWLGRRTTGSGGSASLASILVAD